MMYPKKIVDAAPDLYFVIQEPWSSLCLWDVSFDRRMKIFFVGFRIYMISGFYFNVLDILICLITMIIYI